VASQNVRQRFIFRATQVQGNKPRPACDPTIP